MYSGRMVHAIVHLPAGFNRQGKVVKVGQAQTAIKTLYCVCAWVSTCHVRVQYQEMNQCIHQGMKLCCNHFLDYQPIHS